VAANEEFNIRVGVEDDVREEETLLTLVLEDPLRNFLVKSNPIKIVGNGSSEFILRLQAPGDECLMHLKLYVSYTIGEDWVNDPTVIEVAINVLRNVIGTVIQRVKEIMYVTKTITATQTITLTKVNTTTVTLNFLKEVGNIKIVFIIIISMMLMTLAISVMLQKSKKVSRQRRCNL
ncbi:MAG: hypothetical protein N3E47_05595, partial [Candidatus Bathyarchaeota archaeon]|nr:hypothetical protein [Candidatus Bathyarchaeota archaeon]